jgi:hypothetical protein
MRRWSAAALALALLCGTGLRLLWLEDMEYKTDEAYMVERLAAVGGSEPWPWLGIASGVHVRNPGMSVWVFLLLGKLSGATPADPVPLARAVALLNLAALGLLVWFASRWVTAKEREPWLWAAALAAVNPFGVLYHRKIWAQSVLPFFSMLFLMAWWRRGRPWGAFFWGLVGACLGQIHMSGFFFAAAFAAWALLFDRRGARWSAWLGGSLVGALPLVPWLVHLLTEPTGRPMVFGWGEALQLKYWVFWLTDPLGLHLGNPLGVRVGNGMWQQLREFASYPRVGGQATWGVGVVHLAIAGLGLWIIGRGALRLGFRPARDPRSATAFTQNAALWAYGLALTVATVAIHRYYMIITFPLEFVWLARLGLAGGARRALGALVVAQLLVSAAFLYYVHVNDGAPRGDYGTAWRAQGAR